MFLDISHFHDFFSFSFSDIFPSVFLLYFFPPFSKCVFLISLVNHNPVLSFSNSIHLSHWEWRERRQAFGCGLWIPGFFLNFFIGFPSIFLSSLPNNKYWLHNFFLYLIASFKVFSSWITSKQQSLWGFSFFPIWTISFYFANILFLGLLILPGHQEKFLALL